MAESVGTRGTLENLVDMLVRLPELADPAVRDQLVDRVRQDLRRPLRIKRFADVRPELSSLVNACNACSGGLRVLASAIAELHVGEIGAVRTSVADLSPGLLSVPDRDHLRGLLANLPANQIGEAVDGLGGAEQLYSMRTWRDTANAIRIMEGLPIPEDGVPQVLAFASRLSELLTGPVSDGLRIWVDTVAGGLGVDLAALVVLRGGAGPLATPPVFTPPTPRGAAPRRSETRVVGGGVPTRNRHFTGRSELLDNLTDVLSSGEQAAVLPPALHGLGGVGKTQLVVEYIYRHLDDYELVWWIPSERTATVLASLTQLAETLHLTVAEDRQQTARTVLDALAGLRVPWLLVYDNADDPDVLKPFLPATGGHVIVTTRNPEWGAVGRPIEVDVFPRAESIQLLEGRGLHLKEGESEALADKLGDLPLALEQAVLWCKSTAMPVTEYIELLDSHRRSDLLSESKPYGYPITVTAFVTLASETLLKQAPATAQLFELLSFLSGEPVSQNLLSRGKSAAVTEPLRATLNDPVALSRVVRDLNNRGLAKVDPAQRIQVHRLVQDILRDILPADRAEITLRNAQRLLAAANPGDPDERGELESQAELGPHLDRARMIYAEDDDARVAVLDHARYLYLIGDYENSLRLATDAAAYWGQQSDDPLLGSDGLYTLRARSQMANALQVLGKSTEARDIARDTYDRMCASPLIGELHEFTLIHANQVGRDMRIAGRYNEALEFDTASLQRHRQVFNASEAYTLRAQANLAVDLRMIGDFAQAFEQDREIANHWEDIGGSDPRALAAYINQARNYYGMGAYRAGLEWIQQWREPLADALGAGSSQVLLADRTYAVLLRKLGYLFEARAVLREHFERSLSRFGETHEFTNAAAVSYANVLRQVGELDEAAQLIEDALERYDDYFGDKHPLTLAARVNQGILLRAMGEFDDARVLGEGCYSDFAEALGANHPYTICAGVSRATDLALAGEHAAAAELSEQMYRISQQMSGGGHEARNGAEHPYLLMRAINLSHDLRAVGRTAEADRLRQTSFRALRDSLGANHPEVQAIERDERTEGDIEPPPT
ncbi:MAG: tetratricopeptide repeat protein [Hamadaea sp.]|uniref:FxSxx-COOH system tetratricopeptide repeat protein n=1 Tax=Hamadaea sp. TaxID=2024425 RepID=UPI0017E754A7|nr:FxSxx-COOH system tetratricopeptide repeat protein [Hamadaea sp.]NUR72331.1 tetratricopeptide repeat protein [Hamadaea sp.]NUT18156.1 tetratricopeptide repeat protein [Hamadaea sp.]